MIKRRLYSSRPFNQKPLFRFTDFNVKLIFLVLFLFTHVLSTANPAQEISIQVKNMPITQVLYRLSQQSGYDFVYDAALLSDVPAITLDATNEPLNSVLVRCLGKHMLDFTFTVDKTVVIKRRLKHASIAENLMQQVVRGKVTDSLGNSLPGVSVFVKGTQRGASTNRDGEFQIQVNPGEVLLFTNVGYQSQEVAIAGQQTINLVLLPAASNLEEVVVTALGIKREARSLGYSATNVDLENLEENRTVNFANGLQGKIAGVNISPPASGPGGSSKIRIRGQSSFGGDNSPLIVVNGIPINNTTNTGQARSDDGGGLQSINPDDIASMTVLKGAAAAALYGFRAKDGVIIITTKSGEGSAGFGVEFNSSVQAATVLDYTDFQYEYGQGENGKRPGTADEAKGSGTWNFGEKFDGQPSPQFDGTLRPYLPHPNKVSKFYEMGTTVANTIAFSGGGDNGNFRVSYANTRADAVMPNSSFNKDILNAGITHNITPKLTFQLNANYAKEKNTNPPQFSVESFSPNTTLYLLSNSIDVDWVRNYYQDENGIEAQVSRFPEWSNPYWVVNKRFENIKRDRIIGNMSLRYQITDWLYLQGRYGQDFFSRYYDYNRPTFSGTLSKPVTGYNGSFYQDNTRFREQNTDLILGLAKSFGQFGIDITAGANRMDQVNEVLGTGVTNFYTMPLYTIANGQIKNPTYAYMRKRVNSVFGSASFSYRNFLYLNVTARNDWFSTLNPASNSYLYPSVSTSFVFTDLISQLPAWLDYGKLRASYAEVGSDTQPYSQSLYYTISPNTLNGIGLGTSGALNPNPNLRPLKIKETEFGLTLQLFDAALNLDVALYRKNTFDEILNVDISQSSGYGQTVVNVGKLRNQGVETLLSFRKKGNVSWETSLNGSYNMSKVLQLANNQTVFNVGSGPWYGWLSHEVGTPLASLRGYDYKRDEQGRILTTNGKFMQGEITNWGSAIYKWIGGWTNTFSYKRFRFTTQIDFKAGAKLLSNSNMNFMRTGQHKQSLVGREGGVVFPGFNEDGTPNTTAVPAQEFYTTYRSTLIATPFIYDASFVRWRSVFLGYDLSNLFSKSVIKSASISFNVHNLLMIKKFVDNLDPEAQGSVSDNLTGIEVHTLPTTRTYGLNLNVKF